MRTKKRIPLGAINIAVTPHSDDGKTYVDLFKAAYSVDKTILIRQDQRAMLAHCSELDPGKPEIGLTGEIHTFTEIGKDWENLLTRKPASDDDLRSMNLQDHLRPNRESFRYFFFPDKHRLVFQQKGEKRSISHASVKKLLDSLFQEPEIRSRFPLVSVDIEQEPETLARIFGLKRLDHLTIQVNRPNPDALSPEEIDFVEGLLRGQKAASLEIKLKHAPGESLHPDEITKRIARVAATSYGSVIAHGRDDNDRPVTINTLEHPVVEPFDYDKASKVSLIDQMRNQARAFLERIIGGKQQPNQEPSPLPEPPPPISGGLQTH